MDAIGKTINDVGKRLAKTPKEQHPGKVIFVITTDGLENASRDFSYEMVKNMITHQKEKYSWEFIFMGANIDVTKEGSKLGIASNLSCSFVASAAGIKSMVMNLEGICGNIRGSFQNQKTNT